MSSAITITWVVRSYLLISGDLKDYKLITNQSK